MYAPEEDASLNIFLEMDPGAAIVMNRIYCTAAGEGMLIYREQDGSYTNTGIGVASGKYYKHSYDIDFANMNVHWVVTDTTNSAVVLDMDIPVLDPRFDMWMDIGFQGNSYGANTTTWFIDDVSLVPEPASLLALAAGLAPLGMLIRRRQR